MSQPRLVDLSHVIDGDGCQYPGLPAPVVSAYRTREETAASYAPSVSFLLSGVEMATNVGTYLDSPYHRYESGTDLAGLPLAKIAALPGLVIRAAEAQAIGPERFAGRELAGRAVLVHTGWARHWKTKPVEFGF